MNSEWQAKVRALANSYPKHLSSYAARLCGLKSPGDFLWRLVDEAAAYHRDGLHVTGEWLAETIAGYLAEHPGALREAA